MRRGLSALRDQTFDLVVIGGGINGAATAREAALRGMKVALLDARDFASGTSSRSSKLIHGGLRYLEQFDFKLVHESRTERRLLQRMAPHLAHPLAFVLPIYRGDPYFPLKIRVGLTIYDLLGNLGREDRHRMLSAAEAVRLLPALRPDGLRAAALYYDSETDDARLTIENVVDAAECGAVVANYMEIRALSISTNAYRRQVVSAEARDGLTDRSYEVFGRFWVNATGPWVDHVRALLPGFDGTITVRLTKGTHLILSAVEPEHALFAAIPPGNRIFLLLPWQGHALLGTTDTDFDDDPATVRPDQADVEYLLGAVNRVLRRPLKLSDILGSFAGLRALAIEPGRSPSENTREYRFHEEPAIKNFISICGGKLTTARALGEKLVDTIAARLGFSSPKAISSRERSLPGGETGPFVPFVRTASELAVREFHLPEAVARRIVETYGSRWRKVLEPIRRDPSLAELLPGSPALVTAEVAFALEHEMAMNVEDVLLRRSGLNWLASCATREAAPVVAVLCARHFGWSADRRDAALDDFTHNTFIPTP
jgi:glycerol-3-phosphate dehydrogenase